MSTNEGPLSRRARQRRPAKACAAVPSRVSARTIRASSASDTLKPPRGFQRAVSRLAAFAVPGPAFARPANGAAAEIALCLPLPPAAAERNSFGALLVPFLACRKGTRAAARNTPSGDAWQKPLGGHASGGLFSLLVQRKEEKKHAGGCGPLDPRGKKCRSRCSLCPLSPSATGAAACGAAHRPPLPAATGNGLRRGQAPALRRTGNASRRARRPRRAAFLASPLGERRPAGAERGNAAPDAAAPSQAPRPYPIACVLTYCAILPRLSPVRWRPSPLWAVSGSFPFTASASQLKR